MCYLNISLITDYDTGIEGDPDIMPVTHDEVLKIFEQNIGRLKELILEIIRAIPEERNCPCSHILEGAR
jgi:5'-methylthioadenosine phosphorylase